MVTTTQEGAVNKTYMNFSPCQASMLVEEDMR